jgi:ubiquitin-protein ligase
MACLLWPRFAVRTSEGPLADVPLHILLLFPEDFPTHGPVVRLYHALPHPNVAPHAGGAAGSGGAAYRVAYWDCNPSLSQWSPAFTVASIVIQLHAFLLAPDLLYDTAKASACTLQPFSCC